MTNLWRRLGGGKRSAITIDQWASFFNFNGQSYPFAGGNSTLSQEREDIPATFQGYVEAAYKSNGVVFACMLVRQLLFSEARFQFRQLGGTAPSSRVARLLDVEGPEERGRPGELFGSAALGVLEKPWPNGTTGDLLTRMIQDVDLSGNFFAYGGQKSIKRMRPDWVTIILGSRLDSKTPNWQRDVEVAGYAYTPGGPGSGNDPEFLLRENVCHWAPIPDPLAVYRGMSWLDPVLREIMADTAATTHKLKFFEAGATPNMIVSLDPAITPESFGKWVEIFEEGNADAIVNPYKTLYLGGGADVNVVGRDMQQLDFKNTQGAGETRIAAAAGVPPVIVGLSEGLQAATYSNYGQARRRLADGTMRPLWRGAAAALSPLIKIPGGSELWYDDRDIPFLAEDVEDAANVQAVEGQTIRTLIDAGYTPESVQAAVKGHNWSLLKHTGLFSVQLQPPGTTLGSTTPPPTNGNGNGSAKPQLPPPKQDGKKK